MDSTSKKDKNEEIVIDFSPLIRLYNTGRVERLPLLDPPPVPPSFDPNTRVLSKDVNISTNTDLNVRLFNPNNNPQHFTKIPLLLYFHGGGFALESTFSIKYHNYLNHLSSQARVLIVSVEYRRAPEHRLPVAYNDCWDAFKWAVNSRETLMIDEQRVYLMGDSAGGNIAHRLAMQAGVEGLNGVNIEGIILVHPYFWGNERIGEESTKREYLSISGLADKIWALVRPDGYTGADHPWINPGKDPSLCRLGCKRVMVCVAEMDFFRDRGLYYKEVLEKCGWKGRVEVVESKGEDHVFHLVKPFSTKSVELMRKIVDFIHPPRCTL